MCSTNGDGACVCGVLSACMCSTNGDGACVSAVCGTCVCVCGGGACVCAICSDPIILSRKTLQQTLNILPECKSRACCGS